MSTNARNALIVLALAGAVYALPGGGRSADFVAAVLGVLVTATLAFIGYRFYRERRVDLFSLGDRHRGLLYGGLGALVWAMAARQRLVDSGGGGTLVWFAVVVGAVYALYVVFRHYRSYEF